MRRRSTNHERALKLREIRLEPESKPESVEFQVTQRSFQALAQNALKLSYRSVLTSWLHETTRNFAIATVRSEERRRLREQEAAAVRSLSSNDSRMDTLWNQVEPHLDEALARLSDDDRDALLRAKAGEPRTHGDTSEAAKDELVQRDEWRNVLSLFNHSGPLDDRHTLLSYRILQENVGEDEAILQLEYHYADGSTPTAPQRYVRIGNEWRQALDFDTPAQGKMSTGLQAEGANLPAQPSEGK